jgi:AraC-like DNA-binding protein
MMLPAGVLIRTTEMRRPPVSDPLDDALTELRLRGAVLLREAYPEGEAVAVPEEAQLAALVGAPAGTRVLPFHLLRRGSLVLAPEGARRLHLQAGDLAIVAGGAAHQLRFGRARQVRALADLLSGGHEPTHSGEAELICGAFILRALPLEPLLAALPPVIVAEGHAASPTLDGIAALLEAEIARGAGDGFTARRLVEAVFAEAVRGVLASPAPSGVGWLAGLADARLAPVLAALHAAPAEGWSVERMAGLAALSPSRFAARFRERLGISAMAYLARLRMHRACRLLQDTALGLAAISAESGYGSLAAFSRAFKATLGCPPARWRAQPQC